MTKCLLLHFPPRIPEALERCKKLLDVSWHTLTYIDIDISWHFLTYLDIRLCPHASAGCTGCSATSSCVEVSGTCQLPDVFYWRHFQWFHVASRRPEIKIVKQKAQYKHCNVVHYGSVFLHPFTVKFRQSQSLPGLPVLLITTNRYTRQL